MPVLPTLNSIKVGLTILFHNEPYIVQTANFVRMQQRKPVMQTKLKHLITSRVVEYSFKAGESVETADLERIKANFLYKDAEGAHFMENANYEQYTFTAEQLGTQMGFLKDGMEVDILLFNDAAITVALPPKFELKVTSTPDGARGDSAQGRVLKDATMENGLMVRVPIFVKEGDTIRVSTETGEYSERVEQKK